MTRRSEGRSPWARSALIGAAGMAAAAGAAILAERALVRRARSAPDPARGEPFAERPGRERRVASFDGTELAVVEVGPESGRAGRARGGLAGTGRPTLVFVHGFSLDMTTWHYQWRRCSRTYRCVLFDQRGHGRSSPAANRDYSVDALGRDLRAVLDVTCPTGPAVLVGHSMGGMAILSLAAQHPEEFGGRVMGVVLAGTAAGELLKEALGGLGVQATMMVRAGFARVARAPRRVDRVRSLASGRGAGLAFLIARATNFGPGAPPSLVDHVTRVSAATPAEVWTDLLANVLDLDLWHALHRVTVPALVLVGDVDRLTPPATARAIADALPDGRLVEFDGAGHCAMLEQPERFNEELERFLETMPVGRAAKGSA